jgi:glycosyltransferase involved in cell wall biosynthesis
LTGENIICFAKDWDETPTSNNHVMAELAKSNRVLWLNSIATRAPSLASGRDLRKIGRKLASFGRGPRRVQDNLWVYTPVVLPLPYSGVAKAINRQILRAAVGVLRRTLGMREFQLWTFLPNAVDYVGALGESMVVYYCVDEWSKFTYLDGPKTADAERRLCRTADVVFASAQSLVDDRRPLNPETQLARHGVDHALFARAMDEGTPVPPDIAALPKPVIGFYGTLQDWVDQDLIIFLARRHPEWSIALIGKPAVDVSRLRDLPNVHLLGRRPHTDLPAYCKGFDVGIIPYVLNDRILHVNPLKLREYLCAGLPVVSVALPEVRGYEQYCTVAPDYGEFERGIEQALRTNTPELRKRRCDAMRAESWQRRVADVAAHVMRVKGSRCLSDDREPHPSTEPA